MHTSHQHTPIVRYATAYDQVITLPRPRGARFDVEEATSLLASCRPCELAAEQGIGQFAPVATDAPVAAQDAPAGTEAPSTGQSASDAPTLAWNGPVGAEGSMTGDGRMIEANALRWEDSSFPQPLRYVPTDESMGHSGAQVVGTILGYERLASGLIQGHGTYDLATPIGREAARQVGTGQTPGISMDLDDVSFEVRVAADLLAEMDTELQDLMDGEIPDRPAPDADGRVTVMEIGSDDEVMVTTSARIRAVTQVAIPAFAEARITLVEENWAEILDAAAAYYGDGPEALAASAAPIPVDPPAAWFENPGFSEITPLTITDEGRVYGHLAEWGTCHTGNPMGNGQCITPPSSPSNYNYFLTGGLLTAEGTEVRVGQITMDTLHATRTLTAAATMAHYEQTGLAMADITVGEDAYGIWFSGALRPGVTPEERRILRASPLSGDWRRFNSGRGPLELVAALAVNVQGYAVPRPQGLVASGSMVSLVASGMVPPRSVIPPSAPGALSLEDLRYLKRLARREKDHDQNNRAQADGLVRRIAAVGLLNSIRTMASTATRGA